MRRPSKVWSVGVLPVTVFALGIAAYLGLDRAWLAAEEGVGGGAVIHVTWPPVPGAVRARITIGPEPPPADGAPLPLALEVATLEGEVTRHRIDRIAPATDLFVRVAVETRDGQRIFVSRERAEGGPRAQLRGAVREVHLVAPDVMAIVLVDGEGPQWSDGPWTVARRDARSIGVRRVHRRSIPVAQPRYDVGFRANSEPDVVVDHWIFLQLAERVGERELLTVRGPRGIDLIVPFSDRYLETPVVQLNQVGYSPRATQRFAYVSFWLGDGGALSLDGFPEDAEVLRDAEGTDPPTVVATLSIRPRSTSDADAGGAVYEIDLSSVPVADGVPLRIRVPGVGVSWATEISDRASFEAYYTTARGLFHNRWAGDLRPEITDWPRPPDHVRIYTSEHEDAFTDIPEDTPRTGARTLRGGHHDAGDFDIRPTHTAVARHLMRAYELAPDHFGDGQLRLPESGNGIPDLLDEALWSVAAWEQLQEADGGVRGGVQSHRHPWGIYFAHDDPLPYWTFARNAHVTARAAALFAQASRLVAPFDEERARNLRSRAERAYRWADARGANDAFLLYAESELLRTTGDERLARAFEARIERLWPDRRRSFGAFASGSLSLRNYADGTRISADYVVGYLSTPGGSPQLRTALMRELDDKADRAVEQTLASPHAHRHPRPSHYPLGWGQAVVPGKYLEPVYARLQLGGLDRARRQRMLDAVSLGADYVLGGNPLGMAMLTGLGSRRPEEPLHLDSLVWIHEGRPPVPGIPVFGPTNDLPRAGYYQAGRQAFYPAFEAHPPALRYADIRTFVMTNEFSVWETQAPQALLFATLIGPSTEREP